MSEKIPGLLTPEIIESLAKNAEAMKSMMSSGEEVTALKRCIAPNTCCCPAIVKTKNILCNVWIKNYNSSSSNSDSDDGCR